MKIIYISLARLQFVAIGLLLAPGISQACYTDPLIIDLGRNGVSLGAPGNSVQFDFMGDGNPTNVQWVKEGGDEAFLVRDVNANEYLDNGQELFGDNIMAQDGSGVMCANGFEALAQFDALPLGGNSDGVITSQDSIWSQLLLWVDHDANGISNVSEMLSLEDFGIESFNFYPRESNKYDQAGNWIPLWQWVSGTIRKEDGSVKRVKYRMVDVVFRVVEPE